VNNNFSAFSDFRMPRRLAGSFLLSLLASATSASALTAQQLRGPGEDALTVPGGTLHWGIDAFWALASDQYGPGGALRPLGAGLSVDSLTTAQLPALTPLQTALRSLVGSNSVNVSLGKTSVSQNNRIQTTALAVEYGLTRRIQIGVTVPLVKTRRSVFLTANPGGQGNIGVNPANPNNPTSIAEIYNTDTTFINQLGRAAAAAQTYCAGAGAATSQCEGITALAGQAQTFSAGLQTVYAEGAYVPTLQSDLQATIDARSAAFRSALNTLAEVNGSGVPTITAIGVIGAAVAPTITDVQRFVQDPLLGLAANPIQTVEQTHLGDVEATLKILLLDSFGDDHARMHPAGLNARLAVGGMYRAPTGQADDPNELTVAPLLGHEGAIGVRGFADVLVGSHFWTSFVARYDNELGTDIITRIPDSTGNGFLPAYRRAIVHRKSGNLLEIEATPRWAFNDFLSVSAQYTYRHKPADEYTGADIVAGPSVATGGTTITIDPSLAGLNTDFSEQRVGGGFAFSNVRKATEGRTSIPFEVSYIHWQTVKASGGDVPKQFADQVRVRIYTRLFGR
jgi:hypothetical protein